MAYERIFAPQLLLLYYLVGSVLYVHFRGRTRHSFLRQLTDHSTFMAPYNLLMYLFSAVPNKPILQESDLPDLAVLRENWKVIREEALDLFDEGRIKASDKYNDLGFNSFFRSGWKRFYLKWYDDPLPSASSLCPHTVALLQSAPSVKAAMFASLAPGGHLVQHRDPFAGSLRYHLGLVTPTSKGVCRIFIDGTPYSWRDGESLVFDETYIHHAENTTDQTRIILFCDIERPLRTPFMRAINHWVMRHVMKESATQNEEGERVGFFNKAFGYLYPVRLVGKALKAKNKNVYYALKYFIVAAILAAIVIPIFY